MTAIALMLGAPILAWAKTPLEVVNARMAAHNGHNITQFMALYSDDIQVYDYPDIPLGKRGKAHIKSIFEPLFKAGVVKTTIKSQMVNDKYIVNRESVVSRGTTTEYISIYEVKNDLIQSVRFIK